LSRPILIQVCSSVVGRAPPPAHNVVAVTVLNQLLLFTGSITGAPGQCSHPADHCRLAAVKHHCCCEAVARGGGGSTERGRCRQHRGCPGGSPSLRGALNCPAQRLKGSRGGATGRGIGAQGGSMSALDSDSESQWGPSQVAFDVLSAGFQVKPTHSLYATAYRLSRPCCCCAGRPHGSVEPRLRPLPSWPKAVSRLQCWLARQPHLI
jgi:hypothetical protein